MGEIIEAFGSRLSILIALLAISWFLISWSPLIWPAVHAYRAKLPRPWLFSFLVAALVYGSLMFVMIAVFIPADAYTIFIAPQLQEMGKPIGKPLVHATRFIGDYWWITVPPTFLAMTALLTRKLAAKWPRICDALAE